MPAVLWSGSPADAKLVGQLRDLGIPVAGRAESSVVAEVVTCRRPELRAAVPSVP